MPKISRRKFIQLGAAALVAGVLLKEKEETFPDWRSFEPGLLEETERQIARAAEQAYTKALEVMPVKKNIGGFELDWRNHIWVAPPEIGEVYFEGEPPIFTSKDCEQAGQAMMDGFMQGIKATLSAEDIEKLARGRDVFEGFVSGIEVTSEIGKDVQEGEVVYLSSRVEVGPITHTVPSTGPVTFPCIVEFYVDGVYRSARKFDPTSSSLSIEQWCEFYDAEVENDGSTTYEWSAIINA